MTHTFKPKRSMEEVAEALEAPGSMYQTEALTLGKRQLKVYKHLPKSMRDIWLANCKTFAKRDYLVYEDERCTYAQADHRVSQAVQLLQSLNVTRSTHVALAMRNLPDFVFFFWATQVLGVTCVGVNAWMAEREMKHCLLKAETSVVICDDERMVNLGGIGDLKKGGVKRFLVVRTEKEKVRQGWERVEDLLEGFDGKKAYPDLQVLPEDPCTIFFTSGTTSLPKGVLATQRQAITNFFNVTLSNARAALRRGEDLPKPDPNALPMTILVAVPLFHVTGCHSYLLTATAVGGKIVLMRKFSAANSVSLIKREKVTVAGGVPYVALEIMEAFKDGDKDHHLTGFSFGGAPSPDRLVNTMKGKFGEGVSIGQAFGLTETNAVAVCHSAEDYVARPKSTGWATPVNKVKICDLDTKKDLPIGQVGEICLHGANVVNGYYKDDKASLAFTDDGWFQTGDVGYMDDEGFLYISDRAKDIIIRGGENISTMAVENVLYDHPGVEDAAVVPVPDDKLGELVSAVVVPKSTAKSSQPPTEAELIAFCAKHLPKHCVPVAVWVRNEPLPRNATSKVLKNVIKAEMGEKWKSWKTKGGNAKL